MPNGGSDHCGNCRHNRVNEGWKATHEQRIGRAFCTVRGVEIRASTYTYCANHYTDEKTPIGPLFGTADGHERVPYLGACYPHAAEVTRCTVCGGASKGGPGVRVTTPDGQAHEFCGNLHYLRWWKARHPGEPLRWDCDAAR